MDDVTFRLSDGLLERLQSKAEQLNVSVDEVVNTLLERYFEEDDEDNDNTPVEDLMELYPECVVDGQFDYEKYSARIEESLTRAMRDALAGRGRPAREVLEEIEREMEDDAY